MGRWYARSIQRERIRIEGEKEIPSTDYISHTHTTVLCVGMHMRWVVCVILTCAWRIWQWYLRIHLVEYYWKDVWSSWCIVSYIFTSPTNLPNHSSAPFLFQLQHTPFSPHRVNSTPSTLDDTGFTSCTRIIPISCISLHSHSPIYSLFSSILVSSSYTHTHTNHFSL